MTQSVLVYSDRIRKKHTSYLMPVAEERCTFHMERKAGSRVTCKSSQVFLYTHWYEN